MDTIHHSTRKEKYKPVLKKDSKSCLYILKRNQAQYGEIQNVSLLLRSKINHKTFSNVDDKIK